MDERELGAPPGWYPTPDGHQRFWDGTQWMSIPPPGEALGQDFVPQRRARRRWPLVVLVAVLVAGGATAGVVVKIERDREVAAAEEAALAEELASAAAAEEAASAEAAAEAAEQRDREQHEASERQQRREVIEEIEESVWEMAEEHVDEGILDGPILSVTCSPVAGGSIEDLTEQTTVFDCFVANEDNEDGTMSGFPYNATMNWTTGSFTYSIGAA